MNWKIVGPALDRIQSAVDQFGPGNVYSAYSGGKDSKAVLGLVQIVLPRVLIVHNRHPGEAVEVVPGMILVQEPKKENVPAFLRSVQKMCQFDGTRKDEDKTVIFDGVEIHRSDMPSWFTEKGVWDLAICYPIWDWTEGMVYSFLSWRGLV